MIRSKADLKRYLEADRLALGHERRRPRIIGDEEWKFQRLLRHQEYFHNTGKSPIDRFMHLWYKFRTHRLAVKLGFTISINTCGPGLMLPHRGSIVINDEAVIGSNCKIHSCVNIGAHNGRAPTIGNNVYIGPGAKIFGGIHVADNIQIGANAVVNKSFDEPGISIGGVPAKKISDRPKAATDG